MKKSIANLPYLKEKRKALRNNLTPAEATLWLLLKNRQLEGRRFRRQFSVGNYILDFYCSIEKLAVELDGQGHYTPLGQLNDETRENYLSEKGIKVIRFENREVFEQVERVLDEIKNNFQTPQSASRRLPLTRGAAKKINSSP